MNYRPVRYDALPPETILYYIEERLREMSNAAGGQTDNDKELLLAAVSVLLREHLYRMPLGPA